MIIDGIAYKDLDVNQRPDLGSWKCAKREKSDITGKEVREYYGLSDDIDKLPTWNTKDKYTNDKYKKFLLQVQLQYVQTQAKSQFTKKQQRLGQ